MAETDIKSINKRAIHDTKAREEIEKLSSQYKDIANLSLIKHTDGKVYIKKQDGTLMGDGIEVGSDTDLSKVTMSMDEQTLKLFNDGQQIATVEIPTAVVTDEQLTSIIQAKIDDGTLASIALGENSVATNNIQDEAVTPNKTNFFKEIKYNLSNGAVENLGFNTSTGATINSGAWNTGLIEIKGNVTYYIYTKNYNSIYALYDIDKKFISGGQLNCKVTSDTITATEDGYLRVGLLSGMTSKDSIISTQKFTNPEDFIEESFEIDEKYKGKLYQGLDIESKTIENIKSKLSDDTFENTIEPRHTKIFTQEDINLFDYDYVCANSETNEYATSNFFKVSNNETIYANIDVTTYTLYNLNKEKIKYVNVNYSERFTQFTIDDENAYYCTIGLGQWTDTAQNNYKNCMLSKEPINNFLEYAYKNIDITKYYKDKLIENLLGKGTLEKINMIDKALSSNLPFKDKTFAIIGDSNTNWYGSNGTNQNSEYTAGFGDLVAEQEYCTFVNLGLAGATWEVTTDGEDKTSTSSSCAVGRVNTIINNNTKYDIILFLMGTNGTNIGEVTDTEDVTNMCGAMHYCLKTLLQKYPTTPIGVILPMQKEEDTHICGTQNSFENKIEKMKIIANYYSIPVLDLFHEGGITADARVNNNTLGDVVHIGNNGIINLARNLRWFLHRIAQPIHSELKTLGINGNSSVAIGEKLQLRYYHHAITEEYTYTWSSSNESIATVDENGLVTGISSGTVNISITASNGVTKSKTITVS